MIRKILIGLFVLLVIIQFIRPKKNEGSATGVDDIAHATTVPPNIMSLLQRSCYDCHSNYTEYPWYASINPVGLWLANHINEGKKELNFSEFAKYEPRRKNRKLDEVAEQIEKGEMPLKSYTLIHTDARLTKEQADSLIQWARAEQQKFPAGKPK